MVHLVFPSKKFGHPAQNDIFPRIKYTFLSQTIFFLGKTKKTIFLVSGRLVSQNQVFFGFFGFP